MASVLNTVDHVESNLSKTFEDTFLTILKPFAPFLWTLIHFVFNLLNLSFLSDLKSWLTFQLSSKAPKLADLTEVQKFNKYPNHLAISVFQQSKQGDIDLKQVAKVITWAYAANVKVVSLHDKEGVLKSKKKELHQHVKSSLDEAYHSLVAEGSQNVRKPTFKILHFQTESSKTQTPPEITIAIYSNEDSKSCIVNAAKYIFEKSINAKPTFSLPKDLASKKIDVETLNTAINKSMGWPHDEFTGNDGQVQVQPDPDLLMVFGNINSTMGFLPWHIRLTEIHWLPPINKVYEADFLKSLHKYSDCEQRVGK